MQLWPPISSVFSQNRFFWVWCWKLCDGKLPFALARDHGEGEGLSKEYQEEGQKTGHFATYHTDYTHSLQEGWFLLPTNLCSAACTCMIHFHHLYLCQNIDRYPCWCIPRWRDQQTQTGGEASFSHSAFWRSWHTSSFIYSLLYWLWNWKNGRKNKEKHWQHRRAEENQWNQTGETKWMCFLPLQQLILIASDQRVQETVVLSLRLFLTEQRVSVLFWRDCFDPEGAKYYRKHVRKQQNYSAHLPPCFSRSIKSKA